MITCDCGGKIDSYRIAGVFLAFDLEDEQDFFSLGVDLFRHRISSVCKGLKMVQCPDCGKVSFYSFDSPKLNGMRCLPNAAEMERLTNAENGL